ncbi:ABC transporter permease subunit [Allohahella marinimesophila]|uniref:ABC transporter permease n=1 Tax=Allohahella marinimesophila TaxID=1054972 RepID=A0ABP7PPM2_9GAMM
MFEYLFDFKGYGPELLRGAFLTAQLAGLSLLLALVLGLAGAAAKLSSSRAARGIALTYTTLIRGVPDLVMMMLIFYGGQALLNMLSDFVYNEWDIDFFINVDQFIAGVLSIGFIFGAYMAETFRGAFLAVPDGQLEAGRAYGMSEWQVFRRIMVPQMIRHAIPGVGNNWLVMLKTTALVSIIGLTDIVRVASEASKSLHLPFKFFIPVVLFYLLMTLVSELFLKYLSRRYSVGVREVA